MAVSSLITNGAKGTLRIWQPTRGILLTQVTGSFEAALVTPFITTFTVALRTKTTHHAFHDWSDMTGYDVDARVALTQWTLQNRGAFASVHFLIASNLVRLGVQVANIALGGFMTAHAERVPFEHAFARTTGLSLSDVMRASH
jgi:hypothetical protein